MLVALLRILFPTFHSIAPLKAEKVINRSAFVSGICSGVLEISCGASFEKVYYPASNQPALIKKKQTLKTLPNPIK